MKPVVKCGDCGALISPKRGYCVTAKCHNKMLGGPTPEARSRGQKARWHGDKKRCPFCLGQEGRHAGKGPCFLSACDRGPGGRSCGCHYKMAGMGSPGYEGRIQDSPRSFARVIA